MRTVKIIIFHILSSETVDEYLPIFFRYIVGKGKRDD